MELDQWFVKTVLIYINDSIMIDLGLNVNLTFGTYL